MVDTKKPFNVLQPDLCSIHWIVIFHLHLVAISIISLPVPASRVGSVDVVVVRLHDLIPSFVAQDANGEAYDGKH